MSSSLLQNLSQPVLIGKYFANLYYIISLFVVVFNLICESFLHILIWSVDLFLHSLHCIFSEFILYFILVAEQVRPAACEPTQERPSLFFP